MKRVPYLNTVEAYKRHGSVNPLSVIMSPSGRDRNDLKVVSPKKLFRCFLYLFLFIFMALLIIGLSFLSEDQGGYYSIFSEDMEFYEGADLHDKGRQSAEAEAITEPIILWWTPLTGERGRYKTCGSVSCYFTVDRHYWHHPQTEVFVFYGSDFKVNDLPLPKKSHHQWALLHEESPKNNYIFSHADALEIFNYTSTFRRQSDFPLVTQALESLEWLESQKYVISNSEKNKLLGDLAPVMYTHSDCNPPSDRDTYVSILMKHLDVDSYGTCLHNRDLPDNLKDPIAGMGHKDFYQLVAKYKFSLALENAICTDYITEKLWRPLMAGSVPIVYGSLQIRDLLPDNHSAILIEDFDSPEDLSWYLKFLLENDEEYEKYLHWKKTGVTNPVLKKLMKERVWQTSESFNYVQVNFIDAFECFLCQKVQHNRRRRKQGLETVTYQATYEHYGCPKPNSFDRNGRIREFSSWDYEYGYAKYVAKAVKQLISEGRVFKKDEIEALASQYRREDK
ncbi:hypothetical protein ScPMuIL_004147 [Solemya velum]